LFPDPPIEYLFKNGLAFPPFSCPCWLFLFFGKKISKTRALPFFPPCPSYKKFCCSSLQLSLHGSVCSVEHPFNFIMFHVNGFSFSRFISCCRENPLPPRSLPLAPSKCAKPAGGPSSQLEERYLSALTLKEHRRTESGPPLVAKRSIFPFSFFPRTDHLRRFVFHGKTYSYAQSCFPSFYATLRGHYCAEAVPAKSSFTGQSLYILFHYSMYASIKSV